MVSNQRTKTIRPICFYYRILIMLMLFKILPTLWPPKAICYFFESNKSSGFTRSFGFYHGWTSKCFIYNRDVDKFLERLLIDRHVIKTKKISSRENTLFILKKKWFLHILSISRWKALYGYLTLFRSRLGTDHLSESKGLVWTRCKLVN